MKRVYIRSIDAGHGRQRLTVEDGIFSSIETYSIGRGYYTEGSFMPADYEEGQKMKRGFLAKYGFNRHIETEDEINYYLQTGY